MTNIIKHAKTISWISIALLGGFFHLVIAAAPSQPPEPDFENLVALSSLQSRSLIEQGLTGIITSTLTAYSSEKEQTDDTPWITAAGTPTRDGVVAANFLPLYTEIAIPEIFGDRRFVVEDRMNDRFNGINIIDIWHRNTKDAKEFGSKRATVLIF